MPTDPLSSWQVFKRYLKKRDLNQTILVSPDMGQAKSAARFARVLGIPIAAGNKERASDTKVKINALVGDQVRGHRCALIYDDEIATGSTVLELSRLLLDSGIVQISLICTHGLFTGDALKKISMIPTNHGNRDHQHSAYPGGETPSEYAHIVGSSHIWRDDITELQPTIHRRPVFFLRG